MKTKDIFEGIQARTKRQLPEAFEYQGHFFPAQAGWAKNEVIDYIQIQVGNPNTQNPSWRELRGTPDPSKLTDEMMKDFVVEWFRTVYEESVSWEVEDDLLLRIARQITT